MTDDERAVLDVMARFLGNFHGQWNDSLVYADPKHYAEDASDLFTALRQMDRPTLLRALGMRAVCFDCTEDWPSCDCDGSEQYPSNPHWLAWKEPT